MGFSLVTQDYENVYLNRDNTNIITVKFDNVEYDLSTATKITLKIGEQTIDSSVSTSAFDWTSGNGILKMKLGNETLNVGGHNASLFVYDADNTNGLYVGSFKIRIVSV